VRRRPRAEVYRPPPGDPAKLEHTSVDLREGEELDPALAARLAAAGWTEVHRSRIGWADSRQGQRIFYERPRALRPIEIEIRRRRR
jgi:hypothetical protein